MIARRAGRWGPDPTGAAATELVLILPILVALVLGISSIGIGYFRKLNLTQGAREAARFGATFPTGDAGIDNAWLDTVAEIARASTFGELSPTVEGQYLCVAYVGEEPILGSSTIATQRRLEQAGTVSYEAGKTCLEDGRGTTERRVQVVVRRETLFDAFWWRRSLTVEGAGVARFEAVRPP